MKFRKAVRFVLAALLMMALLCAPALAKVVSPGTDFYYLDDADVLSEALEGEIYFSNKLLYEACGAQIVVVTVDSTGREAIDDYAYDLFNDWAIGDAAKNNGFLLLLAIGDDDYYARTGSGLDSRFSAGTIKRFYDDYLEGDFAAGNYEAGVKAFFEAVFAYIADLYNAEVTVQDGIEAYQSYVAQNRAAEDFGGYGGNRRSNATGYDYRGYGEEETGIGLGLVLVIILVVVLIVLMSKGGRARRRMVIMPPPPPAPRVIGYRPTRTVYHSGVTTSAPRRSTGWSLGSSGRGGGGSTSFGSGSSRSSFGSGSSRSSFGGSSSRSSFGGSSSRSSGFGGGGGGGGHSSGGGAGRGRH